MKQKKEIGYAMLSGIMFGLIPVAVKYVVSEQSLSIYTGLFFRYVTATIFLAPLGLASLRKTKLEKKTVSMIGLDALLCTLTALFLYGAYGRIPTGIASTIHYLYPLFVISGSTILFRERLKKEVLAAIPFCFGGMMLLCNPKQEDLIPFTGILFALLSAICFSGYLLLMNKIRLGPIEPSIFSFLLNGFGAVYLFFYQGILLPSSQLPFWELLICFLPAGFFSMLAYLTQSAAVRKIGAVKLSMLGTLEPVASLIGGAMVLGEQISFMAVIGCVLILISALLVQREKGTAKSPK